MRSFKNSARMITDTTDHSVLHCVHFMWLQPALFCVATLQPGHGLVNDLITSSVFFSASMLSRAHCEQLLPG